MDPDNKALNALLAALDTSQVITDPEVLYAVSMDNLRYSRMPSACIRPRDEEAVDTVLRLANSHGIAVTTRGAGSATTGATSPAPGGWVLDMSGWKQLHIDPVARMAYVQPGVTLAELDEAAARHNLAYPPDPGSKAYATVGGTIATNAGGMRGAKYGVTRDYVLSLEGCLPTGEFVRWAGNLRKFSAGYNLRDLWIGSEGTLGIITGAVLKLIPRPPASATCLAVFGSDREALECSQELLRVGQTPSALEFLDTQTVACTFSFWKRKSPHLLDDLPDCLNKYRLSGKEAALLLIEVDGRPNEVREQLDAVTALVADRTGDYTTAIEEETVELLWKVRRSCSQAMFELGTRKLNEDVVVPFDAQLDLLQFVHDIHHQTGLPTPTFGHAADGNFHVHIMYNETDAEVSATARTALQELMEKVIDLGGAISGEHGIGLAKSPFFQLQHSEAEIRAMRAIKEALDPNGILNPGKLWEISEPWSFTREDVRMPWDH
ncbi:MAG: FAD-binding oxidoreductase [Puniceicoccaceae bacterium]